MKYKRSQKKLKQDNKITQKRQKKIIQIRSQTRKKRTDKKIKKDINERNKEKEGMISKERRPVHNRPLYFSYDIWKYL